MYEPKHDTIDNAIGILKDIEGDDDWHSTQLAIWIMAITFFCVHAVYMGVNITCYSVRWCREDCFCHRRCCFVTNKIVYASISLAQGISMVIINSFALAFLYPRYQNLQLWADQADSVDEYMKISQEQKPGLMEMETKTLVNFVLSVLILIICVNAFITQLCFCCKNNECSK